LAKWRLIATPPATIRTSRATAAVMNKILPSQDPSWRSMLDGKRTAQIPPATTNTTAEATMSARNPTGIVRREVTVAFEAGLPVALDGERLGLADLITRLNRLAGPTGSAGST